MKTMRDDEYPNDRIENWQATEVRPTIDFRWKPEDSTYIALSVTLTHGSDPLDTKEVGKRYGLEVHEEDRRIRVTSDGVVEVTGEPLSSVDQERYAIAGALLWQLLVDHRA